MKQKLLALLALVMTAMTASAVVEPTYPLTPKESGGEGTITFKVDNNVVTKAPEGATVTLTVAPEFVGTLEATTIAASTEALNNYALNGKQFVWVMNAIPVAANKCWLQIPNSEVTARNISIVFGDATGISHETYKSYETYDCYDLSGRKLNGMPTKKGIYVKNGRKVVVK